MFYKLSVRLLGKAPVRVEDWVGVFISQVNIMNTIVCLLVVALAITAEAGMIGGPPGAGGPPGGIGAGPPPFVQAIIASKGKPFAGGPGGPGVGMGGGPPPFVQAKIASKGFPGGAPAPAPAAPVDPMPAYIQSLLAAKMASVSPFMPPSIPMGPPPFVQQLIAAKNAAAAQEAADAAAAAQQLAAYEAQAQTAGASGSPIPSLNASRPLALGAPAFVQNIISQKGSPSAASPAAATPPDWIQQLLATQMAKKAAAKLPAGLSASLQPSQPGSPNPVAQAGPGLQRRQADLGVPQQSAAPASVQYASPPNPYALPPPGFAPMPMPYPMMPFPFFNPMMPLWKMG